MWLRDARLLEQSLVPDEPSGVGIPWHGNQLACPAAAVGIGREHVCLLGGPAFHILELGVDVNGHRAKGRHLNREYETGFRGVGQRYGINLATNETDVFFQRFLFPTVLKQDPRYFRNPDLPFFQRALYAMSRVLITRTDSGGQTFNSSRILSIAASRAVSDLYVPGERQGMHPIAGCVSFTLLRDAGENLLHEFWPDVRRKFLHR